MKLMRALFAVTFPCLFACNSTSVSGNSFETENTVALQTVNSEGKPISGVSVLIRPMDYALDTSGFSGCEMCENLVSDSLGEVVFSRELHGRFIAEGRLGALRGMLAFEGDSSSPGEILIDEAGSLSGQFSLPEGVPFGWIQILGLDYISKTDSSGNFVLDSLPAGELRMRVLLGKDTLSEIGVTIRSSETLELGLIGRPAIKDTLIVSDTLSELDTLPENFPEKDTLPLAVGVFASISLSSLVSNWMYPLYDSTVVVLRFDSSYSEIDDMLSEPSFLVSTGDSISLPYRIAVRDSIRKKISIQVRVSSSLVKSDAELLISSGKGNVTENIWEGIPDSVRLHLNSVTFGDFLSGNYNADFPAPIPDRYWYAVSSDAAGMTFQVHSAAAPRTGLAGHLGYSGGASQWALLGVGLDGFRDFTLLDSIAFWAHGTGNVSIAFEKLETEISGKSWAHADISPEWERYVFKPSDMLSPEDTAGSNIGWENVCDSVSNIAIFGNNGGDLWIDEITLYGISRDDLK